MTNKVSSAERTASLDLMSKYSLCFPLSSPPLLSQPDYKENVAPDQLMVYDTKKTFPDSGSLRPPGSSL